MCSSDLLKRVELAMALANDPKLLLMDEPTAGMAPRERVALMELAARLAKARKIAVLFTEHDMDVVFGLADRIVAYVAPVLLGRDARPAFDLAGPATLADATRWRIVDTTPLGADVRITLDPVAREVA